MRSEWGSEKALSDLPDAVLQRVLGQAAEVADGVRTLFTRLGERRETLRASLLLSGRIRSAGDLPAVGGVTVAAVDGGSAVERALGVDTTLAVAVGVEGLTEDDASLWSELQYITWQRTFPYEGEGATIASRGIMTALELSLLRDAPHEVLFLDGSHLTPIIGLNAMLSIRQESLRTEIAATVEAQGTADALQTVLTRPEIIAIVQHDNSRDLAHTWLPKEVRGAGLGLDDRTTMSLLLEEGEYTEPQPVALTQQSKSNWLTRQIPTLNPVDAAREKVRLSVNEGITLARTDQLFVTYFRPYSWSPAYRLEIKPQLAKEPERLAKALHALRSQIVSSEIREPYPQWVANRMTYSISDALVALRTAIAYNLADSGLGEYVSLMATAASLTES